jgi:hypothetical protein
VDPNYLATITRFNRRQIAQEQCPGFAGSTDHGHPAGGEERILPGNQSCHLLDGCGEEARGATCVEEESSFDAGV